MQARLKAIQDRISKAAEQSGREAAKIRLVAVSKTMPVDKLKAAVDCGVTLFGENYIQEAREKFNLLYTQDISWHFIGHLQSNKAKYAVKMFDLIHSVDSLKLAREIDKQAAKIDKIQEVLVQVNIAEEASKSGVSAEATTDLIKALSELEHIAVKGLMTMPPYFNAPEKVRPLFAALRHLRDQIQTLEIPGIGMTELSMGMTGDFETAVQEGATLVRIGTAIFGERL